MPRPRCTGGVVERAGRLSDPPPPTPPPPLPTPLPPAMVVLANTEAIEVGVGVGVGFLELALVCLPVCVVVVDCRVIIAKSRSSVAIRRINTPSRSSPGGGGLTPLTRPPPSPCPGAKADPEASPSFSSVNRSPEPSPCPDAEAGPSPCPGAPVSAAERRCLSLVVSRAASTLSRS